MRNRVTLDIFFEEIIELLSSIAQVESSAYGWNPAVREAKWEEALQLRYAMSPSL